MSEQMFDWGFTAVSENELDVVLNAEKTATVASADLQELQVKHAELQKRLENVYAAIQPFFNNLKANPEKDYIYWKGADRVAKIDAFNQHLKKIAEL